MTLPFGVVWTYKSDVELITLKSGLARIRYAKGGKGYDQLK